MEFRVLGPLEIHVRGHPVPLSGARQRKLLALLLLNAGHTVPLHTLVDAVWEENPPATAKRQVQNSMSALRRLLATAAEATSAEATAAEATSAEATSAEATATGGPGQPTILSENNGYRLRLAAATLDSAVFSERVDRAREMRAAGLDDRAAAELRSALGLWRGPALAGLTGQVVQAVAARLDEQRQAAIEEWVDVELAVGRHAELVGELVELAAMNPFRERLVGQLMVALHRSGRQSEALAAYRRFRERLADELGLDPGAALQRLHSRILGNEDGLDTGAPAPPMPQSGTGDPASHKTENRATPQPTTPTTQDGTADPATTMTDGDEVPRPAGATAVVPAQLPTDITAFAGRSAELKELDLLLDAGVSGSAAGPVMICAIAGTAGVGKTALAVHWSHRIRHRFPDGQLYVNLRGFDPAGPPVDPGDALRGFLDALGVSAERIPVDLPARAALYRSLLANRRMLVVLDNTRDAGQVRWLLPGSPTCLVVTTSRSLLAGLVAAEGAQPVVLDLLAPAEARQMLAGRLGQDRLAAEPGAVDEIVGRCARLPLAIAVASARAATHPGFPLAAIAGELRGARGALDPFAGADPATDVRAVLSWSYRQLSSPAQAVFRLLGLHPGPDVTVHAAASLAGAAERGARAALAELTEANLVDEHSPGRYAFHDLLRAYAGELVCSADPPPDRRAALHRLFDHYLHTAYAADRMLDRFRDPIGAEPPRPGAVVFHPGDHEQAMGWFAGELPGLLAAVERAADTGFDGHAWRLAWALAYFLERRGHWLPWASAQRTALAAARRLGDRTGQAHALRSLGRVHVHLGRPGAAIDHLRQAHDLFKETGDLAGHARIHFDLCWISTRQGDHRRSLDHARQALELFQATDNRSGQARALNNVAWGHNSLGDHAAALAAGKAGLALNRQTGDRYGEADSWDTLGHAHLALGNDTESVRCYLRAVALYRDLGHRWGEADTLIRLGDAYHRAGNPPAAAGAWRRAVAILDDLGHPDAGPVREKLAQHRAARYRPTDADARPPDADGRPPDADAAHPGYQV